jgi:hypothetical protein
VLEGFGSLKRVTNFVCWARLCDETHRVDDSLRLHRFTEKVGPRLLYERERTDVVQFLSSRIELRCSKPHYLAFWVAQSPVVFPSSIHPGAPFLHHLVKNTPDTIPPIKELESLRAELVELLL